MTDETVGHMHEKVVIPPAEEIRVVERNWYTGPKEDYRPYRFDGKTVAPMVKAGDGYRFHSTGLTHDERGYPTLTPEMNKKLVTHLIEKIEATRTRSFASRRMACTARTSWWCPTASPRASPSAPYSRLARQGLKVGLLTAHHGLAVLRDEDPQARPQGESHRGSRAQLRADRP